MTKKRLLGTFRGQAADALFHEPVPEILAAMATERFTPAGDGEAAETPADAVTLTADDGTTAVTFVEDPGTAERTILVYGTRRQRRRYDDAEKLAIIAEHLKGDNIDTVQRRHGLGHSTVAAWMAALGIAQRDPAQQRRMNATAKENERLAAKVEALEATVSYLREENVRLREKIRSARTALMLVDLTETKRQAGNEAA